MYHLILKVLEMHVYWKQCGFNEGILCVYYYHMLGQLLPAIWNVRQSCTFDISLTGLFLLKTE